MSDKRNGGTGVKAARGQSGTSRPKNKKLPWLAAEIEMRSLVDLIPSARNARLHSAEQLADLGRSMEEVGFTNPVLVAEDGEIIAGHGRVEAAELIGLTEVPVIVARGWSEKQRRLYMLADNRIALSSSWDEEKLKAELASLVEENWDVSLTGFKGSELDALLASAVTDEEDGGAYSRKIVAPVYQPAETPPPVSELYDDAKARALTEAIRAADLPADVAAFLEKAAERHTAFNFARIADFYASAEAPIQRLMEASALVIIDFNQAVENGFVKLTKNLGDLVARDHPDA